MFDKFFEWSASRSQPRFRSYRSARLRYEAYVQRHRTAFDQLTDHDMRRARSDPELQAAERDYREAIRLCGVEHAAHDHATALYQLGMLLHLQGRFAEAEDAVGDALRRASGLTPLVESVYGLQSGCHYHLGLLALRRGDQDAARAALLRSLEIDRGIGDIGGIGITRAALERCEGGDEAMPLEPDPVLPDAPSEADGRQADQIIRAISGGVGYPDLLLQSGPWAGSAKEEDDLWVLSESEAANDALMADLGRANVGGPLRVSVTRAAFGSPDPDRSSLDAQELAGRLCGAVLVIERRGLEDGRFRYWMQWCAGEVATRPDFRLFVHCEDVSMEEVQRLAAAGDEVLAALLDTVQVTAGNDRSVLCHDVLHYLRHVSDVRALATWRALRITASIWVGRIAGIIQVGVGIAVAAGFIVAVFYRRNPIPVERFGIPPALVGVIFGAIVAPMLAIPIYLLFRGPRSFHRLVGESPRLGRWFVASFLLSTAGLQVPLQAGSPRAWIVLGIVCGVLLDVAKRGGRRMTRVNLSLGKALGAAHVPSLSPGFAQLARGKPIDPMTCSIFPTVEPRVFLSYTRASKWSRELAWSLHTRLQEAGCKSFLDRQGIGQGSNWRTQLNESISDANVFVAILDDRALAQRWVAAELIVALASQRLTGVPEVILLTHPELPGTPAPATLPPFEPLIRATSALPLEYQPHVLKADDPTLSSLVASLRPGRYRTASILPPRLTFLMLLSTLPAVAIGSVGAFLGLFALLAGVLDVWERIDAAAWMSARGLIIPGSILCAYLLGHVARLMFASLYEVKAEHPGSLGTLHAIGAIGFGLLLTRIGPHLSGLVICWAAVAIATGWIIADDFVNRSTRKREV